MTIIAYIIFVPLAAGAIGAQWAFSRLLDIEFTHFHDQWLADGRPVPVFGGGKSRKEADFLSSSSDCLQRWLLSTPSWAKENNEAMTWLGKLRLFSTIMLCGLLGFFALVMYRITLG